MLDHWFKPSKASSASSGWAGYQIGSHISPLRKGKKSLPAGAVVLIGLDQKADAVRTALYELSFPFSQTRLVDLGNFRKKNLDFMIPALEEVLKSRIVPVLIGEASEGGTAAFKAINRVLKNVSLCITDERLTFNSQSEEPNYFEAILSDKQNFPYHLSALGLQAHFMDPAVFKILDQHNFEYLRLGRAKADLGELEPIIRDADVLFFNTASIQAAYMPQQLTATPSGFTLEEACTITRYAGMSDKLKVLSLFGFDEQAHLQPMTAQGAAQIVWYFLDGYHNRKNDFPVSMDGLTEYIVDLKQLDYQITFWRSSRSGRWWMQVPYDKQATQRHALVSCSYNDYKKASSDELPERLLQALKRFS